MLYFKTFSSKVEVAAGEPLGGSDPSRLSSYASSDLEVNGLEFTASNGRSYCVCSVDALYAGRLVDKFKPDESTSYVFAASHTHYAPMIDDRKPLIGRFSQTAFDAYVKAINHAQKKEIKVTRCRLYRGEVDVPVYRRFDYPNGILNRFLTRHFGFYPNEAMEIDRSIYVLIFDSEDGPSVAVAYHACHPVTRGVKCEVSADYIGAMRQAIRKRFSVDAVIFLQGCTGDVRPNLAEKRVAWLPRCRWNWKFNWHPVESVISEVNSKYAHAIQSARECRAITFDECSFCVDKRLVSLNGDSEVEVLCIKISHDIEFNFLPFEISHRYHLDSISNNKIKFIVSCVGDTIGYLPHPSQYHAGGYEVDGSSRYMGLRQGLKLKDSI